MRMFSYDAETGETIDREMTPEEISEFEAERAALPPFDIPNVESGNGPYRLFKSVFINRLNDEEAETMETVLSAAPAKLRLMFNSVEYFVSDDPLFATLVDAVGVALGAPRAEELLGPEF